jgi:hypothetical protein
METTKRKIYVFVKATNAAGIKKWERRVRNGIAKEIVNSIHGSAG